MVQIYMLGFLATFIAIALIMVLKMPGHGIGEYISDILSALVIAIPWFITIPVILFYGLKR